MWDRCAPKYAENDAKAPAFLELPEILHGHPEFWMRGVQIHEEQLRGAALQLVDQAEFVPHDVDADTRRARTLLIDLQLRHARDPRELLQRRCLEQHVLELLALQVGDNTDQWCARGRALRDDDRIPVLLHFARDFELSYALVLGIGNLRCTLVDALGAFGLDIQIRLRETL